MEQYRKLAKKLIEQHIKDVQNWDRTITRKDILIKLADGDTGDVFGSMTGSRTCSTYEAQKFINEAGGVWNEEIIDLFAEQGEDYFDKTLKRGAEVFDVITLELVAPKVINGMMEAK